MPPYRIVEIVLFIPATGKWLTLRPIRPCDFFLLGFTMCAATSVLISEGFPDGISSAGSLLLDTFGAYLIGRTYVRSAFDFSRLARTVFLIIVLLIPLAIFESITSRPLVLDALRALGAAIPEGIPIIRFHLYRAQTVFEHSIHHGMFCATGIGLAIYAIGSNNPGGRWVRAFLTTLSAAFSVSSGALLAAAIQYFFLAWEYITGKIKKKWLILAVIFVVSMVVVELFSNRGVIKVLAAGFAFDAVSSFNRVLIWQYGSAEVLRHPIFGIGFDDWVRPAWMGSSVDNFFLLIAMRHGVPALTLLILAIGSILSSLGRVSTIKFDRYRRAIVLSLGGFIVGGTTVHFWGGIYSYLMFLLGSGLWILDAARYEYLPGQLDGKVGPRPFGHIQSGQPVGTSNPQLMVESDANLAERGRFSSARGVTEASHNQFTAESAGPRWRHRRSC